MFEILDLDVCRVNCPSNLNWIRLSFNWIESQLCSIEPDDIINIIIYFLNIIMIIFYKYFYFIEIDIIN